MHLKALVTGGNRGIGLAITKRLLTNGIEVIVVARDFTNFTLTHDNLKTISFDLSQTDKLAPLVEEIGHVDILVNNAGFMQAKFPYDNYPKDAKETLMKVNLYTPVELMNLCSKSMKEHQSGRIINLSSVAGQIGHPDVWYGISKAALLNATKIYAKLLGEFNICVNAIAPSPVETAMQQHNDEARKKAFKQSVSSQRFATADEIAECVYWLATTAPRYLNGSCLDVNDASYVR